MIGEPVSFTHPAILAQPDKETHVRPGAMASS